MQLQKKQEGQGGGKEWVVIVDVNCISIQFSLVDCMCNPIVPLRVDIRLTIGCLVGVSPSKEPGGKPCSP